MPCRHSDTCGARRYLERIAEVVDTARRETGADQVDLLGHSGAPAPALAVLIGLVVACAWRRRLPLPSCSPANAAPPLWAPAQRAAGGWLARAFIGQARYRGSGPELVSLDTLGSADLEPHPAVRSLTTLGTPHRPPPADKARWLRSSDLGWGGWGCMAPGLLAGQEAGAARGCLVSPRTQVLLLAAP